jgi:hypothetical protein
MRGTRTAALACTAILAAAGCSTTRTGHGFGPVYTTVSGLAANLAKGTNDLTSVRGTLRLKAGPLDQTSTFSEQLSRGKVTAIEDKISTTYQGKTTPLHLIIAGGKLYVERAGQSGKPWVIASPDSSDPVVAALATNTDGTLDQAAMHQYVIMVSAAQDLRLVGSDDVDGVACVHYHLLIDTHVAAQKPPGAQGQQLQQAIAAGVDSIPMDLWVDANGRSVRLTDQVTAHGSTATVDLRLNHFDEDVSIAAPPADQVSDS